MTVKSLLSHSTPPLRPEDTVEYALGLLMEIRVRHLPVVSSEMELLGVLSEGQLLDADNPDVLVGTLIGVEPVSISEHAHVFEATKVLMDHNLTTLAVVSESGRYLGLVRRHDLFDRFARMLATQESGAIVSLEIAERDAALSRIIHIFEQNGVRVLSLSTEAHNDAEGTIGVTVKVNVREVSRIKHLLEHNGYKVVAAFGEDEDPEDLLDRVQEFMRYLEV